MECYWTHSSLIRVFALCVEAAGVVLLDPK